MDKINQFGNDILNNSQVVYGSIMAYLPKFLMAITIGLAGYFIAVLLEKAVKKVSRKLKLDSLISKTNLDEQLAEAGVKMKISKFLGTSVKWVVLIITVMIIADMFNLSSVQMFIKSILSIIGNIIKALVIFAIAVYAARFAGALGRAVANYVEFKNTKLISDIIKGIIYFAALMQVLSVLGVNQVIGIINGLIYATFFGFALALGISFGFGGQERAKTVLEKIQK